MDPRSALRAVHAELSSVTMISGRNKPLNVPVTSSMIVSSGMTLCRQESGMLESSVA